MRKIKILTAILLFCAAANGAEIVPKPVCVEKGPGTFMLTPSVWINYTSPELMRLADYLACYLPGCRPISSVGTYNNYSRLPNHIYLELDPTMSIPSEGYRMSVTGNRIRICGKDYGGVFNGIQTLLQLLPAEVYERSTRNFRWPVEGVIIEDYPRFAYRGFMLDAARTFIPKDQVLRFIDNIAYHKINKLHFHLTDDEAWRVEIKSYPKLAEEAGFRGGDSPVKPIYGAWDEVYGGFYTQGDIHEIVAYASARNVEIIPEIELPGHSRCTALVYPDILCSYTPDLTATADYDRRNVWCVAREENYAMLDKILREMSRMFPSEHIHLGGDEVEPGQWSRCPDCRALMTEKGIKEPIGLEDVFMERVVAIAAKYGKTAGVWNEAAASGKLDKSTVVWGWKNVEACRKVAAAGYPLVVVPGKYFYFDMRQSQNETGHIWAGIVSPETVYSFDFAKEGFTAAEMENVRGVEATFFSELLLSQGLDFLDYQLYPRICALAELNWTPQAERSWSDFESRLADAHYDRLGAMGIKFRTAKDADTAADMTTLYPRKTPAATFTSSLKEAAKFPYSNVAAYKTMARSNVTCRDGDWFMWRFAEPVSCRSIEVKTGYEHLPRAGIPFGRVEVSYDGRNFERVAELKDLGASVIPDKPLLAVRIVSETTGNGEPFVIIQPLDIR